jgi:drug/metabolite transporter (DMT)-like permease
MTAASNGAGIAAVIASASSFVLCDSLMKLAMLDGFPPFQVLCMRGIAGVTVCFAVIAATGQWRKLSLMVDQRVALRALIETVAVMLFILALARMPIGDVTAIMQITPLFLLLAVAVIWREPVGAWRLSFVALGFLGALLVAQPGGAASSPFAVLAFLAAGFAAARDLVGRRIPTDVPILIATFATLVAVMLGAGIGAALFETVMPPNNRTLWLMAGSGAFLILGHFFLLTAFRLAPVSVVAPFLYTFTVAAVLSGLMIFREWPNALALIGIALIIGSGIAVVLAERTPAIAAAPAN